MRWDCNGKNAPTKEEETEREKKLNQRWHYTAKEEKEDVGKTLEGRKEKSTVKVLQRTPSKKRKKKE